MHALLGAHSNECFFGHVSRHFFFCTKKSHVIFSLKNVMKLDIGSALHVKSEKNWCHVIPILSRCMAMKRNKKRLAKTDPYCCTTTPPPNFYIHT